MAWAKRCLIARQRVEAGRQGRPEESFDGRDSVRLRTVHRARDERCEVVECSSPVSCKAGRESAEPWRVPLSSEVGRGGGEGHNPEEGSATAVRWIAMQHKSPSHRRLQYPGSYSARQMIYQKR